MKTITAQTMQEIDRKAIGQNQGEGWRLMSLAGAGIANHLELVARYAEISQPRALFFAGTGNNGGDAFVAARLCAARGWTVQVWLAGDRAALKGHAASAAEEFERGGLDTVEFQKLGETSELKLKEFNPHILVDGLLGTGAKGEPRGAVSNLLKILQTASRDALCVAIDVPSGLHADTGVPGPDCVKADLTLTLGLPKVGLLKQQAGAYVGSLEVIPIGLPEELIEEAEAADEVVFNARSELRSIWKPRERESHKGTFGRVLIIGGSPGMSGAPALSAMAALHAGAGLVSVLAPDSIASEISAQAPEVMVRGAKSNQKGLLDVSFLTNWQSFINDMDCVVIGPGLGQGDDMISILRQLIRDTTVPVIMDADALNNLERQAHWMERARVPLGITPHPGEMSRLFGQSIETIQNDREGMAVAAAKFIDSTVILKGAGTLIAHPEKGLIKNLTGNPGMASGGTGDALAGIFGAFVAQGYEMFDAARLAVYLHGKAGDIAAFHYTQSSTTASRLIERLPEALRLLEVR